MAKRLPRAHLHVLEGCASSRREGAFAAPAVEQRSHLHLPQRSCIERAYSEPLWRHSAVDIASLSVKARVPVERMRVRRVDRKANWKAEEGEALMIETSAPAYFIPAIAAEAAVEGGEQRSRREHEGLVAGLILDEVALAPLTRLPPHDERPPESVRSTMPGGVVRCVEANELTAQYHRGYVGERQARDLASSLKRHRVVRTLTGCRHRRLLERRQHVRHALSTLRGKARVLRREGRVQRRAWQQVDVEK
mmetsp:Transcript_28820/g.67597  ORF Transcript_28820/g.67597 Transcript_28820/m.67597 type:complete len:250 (+) Transcript_28820:1386-2135(+)